MSAQPHQSGPLLSAIVKQVQSGDSIILRTHARGGPPKEKILGLSNIIAPKLARQTITDNEVTTETIDEPYAWEAREFLRKKLVGKEVCFTAEKAPNANREYGTIYLGKDTTAENITETLVSEGLVEVRKISNRSNPAHQRLCELEDIAKAAGKGKHGAEASKHVRDVKWTIENQRNFMDSFHQQPVKAIVEKVRDGSTLRVLLLPDFHYITLMLAGIRCPSMNLNVPSGDASELYAKEAKFYSECRLLQRDVEIILEGESNKNFYGTVLHPNGNITELLLNEGFAKCVDWSLQFATGGPEKLRAAERQAKEKHLRVWKDYVPSGPIISAKEKEFQGKVVEVINADTLIVKSLLDGSIKKIFLASIRAPRLPDDKQDKMKSRPLYDIPYMFEAREFLRKKLIGKKVNITVDYKQPAKKDAEKEYPEKVCCTVSIGGVNVAEALVSKGLATVLRYRQGDDQRSSHYDELLAAETKAQKSASGLHSKDDPPAHRVVDLAKDTTKAKQFFPFLQNAGKMKVIVEFVSSGSRLRLFAPRENYLFTFLLAGITCAKSGRIDTRYNEKTKGDAWGDEAQAYTKELCLQKEVLVEVDTMDKAGSFIGWLWVDGNNLSVELVREGFAEVHISAERSTHYRALQQSENEAKSKNSKIWEHHVPADFQPKEETERKVEPKRVEITEVRPDLTFYAQFHDEGPKLVELLKQLRSDFSSNAPLPGSYIPKKNELCAALFSADGMWYRAKVDKLDGKAVYITYIDYGNHEVTSSTNLAALPANYHSLPPAAREYNLAFVNLPKDPENIEDARIAFENTVLGTAVILNTEYKVASKQYVTLVASDDQNRDIGKELVENGYLVVDNRKEKRFRKIVKEYLTAQDTAKKERKNLWCYGDITEDDAKEFG